jgi:endonuclease/exonuclease/phosphatase family metal-dependent hydrolase
MDVITWNTGRFHWPGRVQSWTSDASLPDVAARLLRWGAPLVFLQEIRLPHQPARLLQLLGPAWRACWTQMWGSERQVLALTRLPPEVLSWEVVDTGTGRDAIHARLGLADGRALHLVGCHACAWRAEHRRRYFAALRSLLEPLPAGDSAVLLGDFNLDPWLARWTRDRETLAELRAGWRDLASVRRATCGGVLRLDHAWARAQDPVRAELTRLPGAWRHGRDHAPLRLTLDPLGLTP